MAKIYALKIFLSPDMSNRELKHEKSYLQNFIP